MVVHQTLADHDHAVGGRIRSLRVQRLPPLSVVNEELAAVVAVRTQVREPTGIPGSRRAGHLTIVSYPGNIGAMHRRFLTVRASIWYSPTVLAEGRSVPDAPPVMARPSGTAEPDVEYPAARSRRAIPRSGSVRVPALDLQKAPNKAKLLSP